MRKGEYKDQSANEGRADSCGNGSLKNEWQRQDEIAVGWDETDMDGRKGFRSQQDAL